MKTCRELVRALTPCPCKTKSAFLEVYHRAVFESTDKTTAEQRPKCLFFILGPIFIDPGYSITLNMQRILVPWKKRPKTLEAANVYVLNRRINKVNVIFIYSGVLPQQQINFSYLQENRNTHTVVCVYACIYSATKKKKNFFYSSWKRKSLIWKFKLKLIKWACIMLMLISNSKIFLKILMSLFKKMAL